MYQRWVKRALDILISAFALLILGIPMLFIALAVRLDSSGPVLFRQKRVGRGKKYFMILKFRSMRIDAPHDAPTAELNAADSYITKVGAFLRKTSLDELPQLLNILVGQMSLIGPRPALWNQTALLETRERVGADRLRPGLTGWAQINGRDELDDAEKARFDGEYAANLSFAFDCKCFFGTIGKVLRGDDIVEGSQEPIATVNNGGHLDS